MAKPKLALIPAAQGTKLYSVLPSDGTGDFDFTRGSVATRINAQGLIENVASGQSRLDYPMIDGVQKGCPHHILEPERTNLLSYSNRFLTPPFWQQVALTVSNDVTISPDGTLNASKLTRTSVTGNARLVHSSVAVSSGAKATLSAFFKYNGTDEVILFSPIALQGKRFSLLNGVAGADFVSAPDGYGIDNYGNGWYRFYIVVTAPSTSLDFTIYVQNNAQTSIYIFGAMLEEGSFPTSYIPTSGESGGVTRSAETASGAGQSSTFNDSEGVLFAEFNTLSINPASSRYIGISNGSADNRIAIRQLGGANNQVGGFVVVGGSVQANLISTINLVNFNKIAVKYKANDFALWVNGIELATDTSGTVPAEGTLNKLDFANFNGSSLPFEGKTKQVQYFDSALADTQLEQLTSWQSFRDMAEGQLYTIE